jgi:hypothetical protein
MLIERIRTDRTHCSAIDDKCMAPLRRRDERLDLSCCHSECYQESRSSPKEGPLERDDRDSSLRSE